MERDSRIYISTSHTVDDFRRLKLNNRQGSDWEKAIEIYRDRITNRYLKQISLLNEDPFTNGFASMALCSLLLDTFYQFERGVKETGDNRVCYTDFLKNHMSDVFDTQEKAEIFYKHIRCGILHSAQTKKGSMLTVGKTYVIKMLDDETIMVDVVNFEHRLNQYFNDYCNRLRTEKTTQSNFKKKMEFVCKHPGY